jgi:ribosomal protein L7/L12
MRDVAVDRVRELLAKGEEVSAINVWRESTGKGTQEALDMIENLEREMNRVRSPA